MAFHKNYEGSQKDVLLPHLIQRKLLSSNFFSLKIKKEVNRLSKH